MDNKMNLEFLDKLQENMEQENLDNDIKIDDEENYQFDIDNEEEAELDFDLNELISKIDAKMEEINKEENSDNISNVFDSVLPIENDETVEKSSDSIDLASEKSIELSPSVVNESKLDISIDDIAKDVDKTIDKIASDNDINDATTGNISDETNKEISEQDDTKDTDINNLFAKVNNNVKEASDIFMKNVEMKKKLDKRFEELKDLQRDIERSKQNDYEEINNYKESVLKELTDKKNEIEARLNELKDLQANFEKEKNDFENYKKEAKEEINIKSKEQKVKDDSRKEELEALEDKLRKQKDEIDEEKRKLSLDRIQYEADKNDLANNMLKFNEIVGTFTSGVGNLN